MSETFATVWLKHKFNDWDSIEVRDSIKKVLLEKDTSFMNNNKIFLIPYSHTELRDIFLATFYDCSVHTLFIALWYCTKNTSTLCSIHN